MIKRNITRDEYIHKSDVENYSVYDEGYPKIHRTLFGQEVVLYDYDWMWHLHLKVTDSCNANCRFCVEQAHRHDKQNSERLLYNTNQMLKQMKEEQILHSVSVTGGEPTAYKDLDLLLDILERYDIPFLTMNTNAIKLDKYAERMNSLFQAIDISRHGFTDEENDNIFRTHVPTFEDLKRIKKKMPDTQMRIQAVLTNIKSVDDMNRFIDTYSFADDISFRRLMILSGEYGVNYSINDDIYNELLEYAFSNWEFKEQTIQDYYTYEIYNNGKTDVTFSYSNMKLLREYEKNERNFYREFIIHPDGCVTGSWQKDNRILTV